MFIVRHLLALGRMHRDVWEEILCPNRPAASTLCAPTKPPRFGGLSLRSGLVRFRHFHNAPFYITRKDGRPMSLAGLWERWKDDLQSCTNHHDGRLRGSTVSSSRESPSSSMAFLMFGTAALRLASGLKR